MRELRPVSHRVRPREIVESWNVAKVLAVRDLKTRYKQSILGPMWLALGGGAGVLAVKKDAGPSAVFRAQGFLGLAFDVL